MTQERIQTRYTLNGPLTNHTELEQAIARAIEAHKPDFFHLLERLVDVGNSGVHLSQEHPPRVLGIDLDQSGIQGLAHLGYESNFFEGCLIVDKYDQHQIDLPFRLQGDLLLFDLELPIAWDFNR
ncbi:hypothetical protein ACSZNF_07645 [Aeromonas hydrophila]